MATAAERMKGMRRRIAAQVGRLSPAAEKDALAWIEQVGLFDEGAREASNATCWWRSEDDGMALPQV